MSSEITTTAGLNYSYEEFNGLDMDDTQAVSTAIRAFVNRHYVKGQSSPRSGSTPGVSLSIKPPNASTSAAHSAPAAQSVTLTSDSEASAIPNNWMVRIRSNKFELGFGYYVLIFLGNVPDEPEQWISAPSFVDSQFAFVNSRLGELDHCRNCREQAQYKIQDFIYLNKAITKQTGLPQSSLKLDFTLKYLSDNLHWRVQSVCSFYPHLEKLLTLPFH